MPYKVLSFALFVFVSPFVFSADPAAEIFAGADPSSQRFAETSKETLSDDGFTYETRRRWVDSELLQTRHKDFEKYVNGKVAKGFKAMNVPFVGGLLRRGAVASGYSEKALNNADALKRYFKRDHETKRKAALAAIFHMSEEQIEHLNITLNKMFAPRAGRDRFDVLNRRTLHTLGYPLDRSFECVTKKLNEYDCMAQDYAVPNDKYFSTMTFSLLADFWCEEKPTLLPEKTVTSPADA